MFSRAVFRTSRRLLTRERLYGGNREAFGILDKEWIPWWVLRTFWKRRRTHPVLLRRPEFAHLQVLELTRPAQARRLLATCQAARSGVSQEGP